MIATTPAEKLEAVLNLYAPFVESEDGTIRRDPSCGLITKAQAEKILAEHHDHSAQSRLAAFKHDMDQLWQLK